MYRYVNRFYIEFIFERNIFICVFWLVVFFICCFRKCFDEYGKYGFIFRIFFILGILDILWSFGGILLGKFGIINVVVRGRVWVLEVFEIVVVVCVFVEFVGFVLVWVEFELIVVVLLGVVEERVGMVFLVKVLFFFGIFV